MHFSLSLQVFPGSLKPFYFCSFRLFPKVKKECCINCLLNCFLRRIKPCDRTASISFRLSNFICFLSSPGYLIQRMVRHLIPYSASCFALLSSIANHFADFCSPWTRTNSNVINKAFRETANSINGSVVGGAASRQPSQTSTVLISAQCTNRSSFSCWKHAVPYHEPSPVCANNQQTDEVGLLSKINTGTRQRHHCEHIHSYQDY